MNNEIKALVPKLVEIIAKDIALQAKNALTINSISTKNVKDKFVKMLMEEINRVLPDSKL